MRRTDQSWGLCGALEFPSQAELLNIEIIEGERKGKSLAAFFCHRRKSDRLPVRSSASRQWRLASGNSHLQQKPMAGFFRLFCTTHLFC
jgi:hypothetical protein